MLLPAPPPLRGGGDLERNVPLGGGPAPPLLRGGGLLSRIGGPRAGPLPIGCIGDRSLLMGASRRWTGLKKNII